MATQGQRVKSLEFYRNKKIFITGITGFKGTWLAHILRNAGAEITGYALEAEESSLFAQTKLKDTVKLVTNDVRNGDALSAAVTQAEPDIVLHLAAQPLVRLSYQKPVETYETNILGTVNILEAIRQAKTVRSFVNVTTDKVYENREWHWGYRENENLNGFDPYSNSKSCSELVTASYRASFFMENTTPSISTARSGNVIGGGDWAADRIIPDCVHAAQSGKPIVVRNRASTRPYQHVLDCLSGYLMLAQKQYDNKLYQDAYNFGPEDESCVTTGELVELFCAAWQEGVSWHEQENKGPHEAHFLKLDCSKAKAVLGWKPQWNIKTAIAKTVQAYKTPSDQLHACIKQQIKEYFYD